MQKLIAKIVPNLLTSAMLTLTIALDVPQAKAVELIQQDLFFGRNIAGGGQVSEEEFDAFVDKIITPRFPAGLTIFDGDGQFKDSTGKIIEEPSKLVTLFVEDTPQTKRLINQIVTSYLQQFQQESVLQLTNKDELKVGFGGGENLIDNDSIPELIEAELFFGRNIAGGGEVSEEEFQEFVDRVITPLFPDGLTVFEANGQFQDSTGKIIEEESKTVKLIFEDTVKNEKAIDQIIEEYIQEFNQESVLISVNEEVEIAFGAGENIIDNDPIPELIEAELFFGRNIAGGTEVSEEEFQSFVNKIITPRFPDGLTIVDGLGQFKDSTGQIIEEESKSVKLIFEDTVGNERLIDEIIETYIQQFNQESVLVVVDENIEVAFDAKPVPESNTVLGLLAMGCFGVIVCYKKRL
jgi:Protein of unknown function (DUF3574)